MDDHTNSFKCHSSILYKALLGFYIKYFSKERYNTHVKSCNSILYTKTNTATYIGSIFMFLFRKNVLLIIKICKLCTFKMKKKYALHYYFDYEN